jgi:hypothetical protein
MKKMSLIAVVVCFAVASHAQTAMTATSATAAAPAPQSQPSDISKVLWFQETDHDFGKIPYGKPVEFDLAMKNLSNDSIRLKNVQAGCGCTTPKWKPGPYAAGETFKITIGFNGYTEGIFNKIVTIYLDNGMTQVIKFHGETFKAPDNPAPANTQVQQLKTPGN